MQTLIALLATIPISYVIDQVSLNDLVKKGANLGYIPNLSAFKKGKEGKTKLEKYKKYIPVVCLVDAIYNAVNQMINKQETFEEMRIHGYFEPMTKEEEELYNQKRTALRVYNLASIRNKKYNEEEKECIKNNIKYFDKTLEEHEIVIKDDLEEDKVDLDTYLNSLSKEELELLKNDVKLISERKDLFDDFDEGDYTLNYNKGKKLVYRFNCKDSDNTSK